MKLHRFVLTFILLMGSVSDWTVAEQAEMNVARFEFQSGSYVVEHDIETLPGCLQFYSRQRPLQRYVTDFGLPASNGLPATANIIATQLKKNEEGNVATIKSKGDGLSLSSGFRPMRKSRDCFHGPWMPGSPARVTG